MLTLTKRLQTIASLVPNGARVCDIGTDHALLSIYILKNKNPESIISTDKNEKPLENAKKNILLYNAENIELRLCDGLDGIKPYEADTVIIAGMGGEVISGILEKGALVAQNSEITFILQPTTSPEFLRRFLYNNGFYCEKEIPVFENNKLYSVMKVKYDGIKRNLSDTETFVGLITPDTQDGLLYLKKQYDRCQKCVESLENNILMANEYNFYKQICDNLKKLIKE